MSADLACWFSSTTNPDAMLVVISGGTDVCSAFVGPVPMLAVVAGEMACRYLGAAVESWSAEGDARVGELGELVITAPLPSMPKSLNFAISLSACMRIFASSSGTGGGAS